MKFIGVTLEELPSTWPKIEHLVDKTVKYSNGRYSKKTVADGILSGLMQLWLVIDDEDSDRIMLAMVTQIMSYPTGAVVCDIVLLGGSNINKWLNFAESSLLSWAAKMGFKSAQLVGRPGWAKMLKNWGSMFIMLERDLENYNG